MNWIKRLFKRREAKKCDTPSIRKGKYVISHTTGLYDLYSGDDVLICKDINFKNLKELIKR